MAPTGLYVPSWDDFSRAAPDLAQAGGKDATRLDEALREAGRLALEALQRIETV